MVGLDNPVTNPDIIIDGNEVVTGTPKTSDGTNGSEFNSMPPHP